MTTGIQSDLDLPAIFKGANLSEDHTEYLEHVQYFLAQAEEAGHDHHFSGVNDMTLHAMLSTLSFVDEQLEGKGSAQTAQLALLIKKVSDRLKEIRPLAIGRDIGYEEDVDGYIQDLDDKIATLDSVPS